MSATAPPLDHAPCIVIAEDDEQLRTLVAESLSEDGFEVLEAGHAEEALRLLCHQAEGVQVLFTDINMPGPMNGLELARRARQRWPWLRVMIGSAAKPDALPSGGRFLLKPYRLSDLRDQIRKLIART
jgi:two-component system, response regulator PdtaR